MNLDILEPDVEDRTEQVRLDALVAEHNVVARSTARRYGLEYPVLDAPPSRRMEGLAFRRTNVLARDGRTMVQHVVNHWTDVIADFIRNYTLLYPPTHHEMRQVTNDLCNVL